MSFGAEGTYFGHPASEDADAPVVPEFERYPIRESDPNKNFEDDWTLLQYERFKNPITKERYLKFKKDNPTTEMRTSDFFDKKQKALSLEKPVDIPIDIYQKTADTDQYDHNLETIFSQTGYANSFEFGKQTSNLGISRGYGDYGFVFRNAQDHNGKAVSNRTKNIVEAHEKAHGLLMSLTNAEKDHIRQIFNTEKNRAKGKILPSYSNKSQIDEVFARMSQLKNYFGFKGGEEFTRDHLDLARENYIKDTGSDNSMSEFFDAIDRENEDRFIKLMNTVAC